jgi:isopentenyl diphosphate isomerase/L-lactate dehydrogenase-like FMN-dependent dehydrogenase
MARLDRCYNIDDLRQAARRRLPKIVFDFIDGGSEDGIALRGNRAAFEQLMLESRYMVDISRRDISVDLFGRRAGIPLVIAPTGMAGVLRHDGDIMLARAAAKFDIPFAMSMMSISAMEDVVRLAGGRNWFQVYMWKERELNYEMIRRAANLGFEALVVTIDSALGRNREHNDRNGLGFPFRPNFRAMRSFATSPSWCTDVLLRSVARGRLPVHANLPKPYRNVVEFRADFKRPARYESMDWNEIAAIRDLWPGKLIVKSVLSVHEAEQAVAHGADGIVVSNHGGRALDSSRPPISVLPEVVAAVGDRTTVLVDSGVRRGSDIAKGLALGASAVQIGRATLYGVAAGGQAGAELAIRILRDEFEKTLGYLGCPNAEDLESRHISKAVRSDYFSKPDAPTTTATT